MDENLHNEIDDLFRDAIEPLSELPAKQIWENIEQQLDKKEAAQYKRKFIASRKVAAVSILLLLSFATFTFIRFNTLSNNRGSGNSEVVSKNSGKKHDLSSEKSKTLSAPLIKKDKTNTAEHEFADNNKVENKYNKDKNEKERKTKKIFFNNAERQTIKYKKDYANEVDIIKNESTSLPRLLKPAELVHLEVSDSSNKSPKIKLPQTQLLKIRLNDSLRDLVAEKSTNKTKKENNKLFTGFSITAFAAPEFAGYNLRNYQANPYDNPLEIEKREKSEVSFSGGILIGYSISKKLSLQSGIIYSSSHISIDPTKIYAVKVNASDIKYRYNTSAGFSYILPSFNLSPNIGDSLYTRASKHTLHYISLPLIIKYGFEHNKLSFKPGVGIALNFLTKAVLETNINDGLNTETESITKLEGLQKVSYSLMFTPELQYRVSEKWRIMAMPYFKYALVSVNKKNIVKTYPYNVGLAAGAVYKLK